MIHTNYVLTHYSIYLHDVRLCKFSIKYSKNYNVRIKVLNLKYFELTKP